MQKITLNLGDILSKQNVNNIQKSIGIVTTVYEFRSELCAKIEFDDDIDLTYRAKLTIDENSEIQEYKYLGQPIRLIARNK